MRLALVNAVLSIDVAELRVVQALGLVGMLETLRDSAVVAHEDRLSVVGGERLEAGIAFVGVWHAKIRVDDHIHFLCGKECVSFESMASQVLLPIGQTGKLFR